MKRFWPYLFLTVIVFLIALLNYHPGAFLTGWDTLHPEFNPLLNLHRTFFTAWQEYQGVGLAGGMGYGADLIRQLFLFLLYPVIPLNQIRFVWTMLTLWIGTVGMYVLIHESGIMNQVSREKNHNSLFFIPYSLSALLGALFYLLNLATLQAYAIPFEVFTAHFAALPWLLLTTIMYLHHATRKTCFWLVLVLLLSTPGAYVPTLFIVYCLVAGILALCIRPPFRVPNVLYTLKLFLIIFLVNAFWLLPFLYFPLTSAHINVDSKINQMATENIFQLNNEFGTIQDVMLLRGFTFNGLEVSKSDGYQFVLAPWKAHMNNFWIPAIGYFLFAVVLLGVWHVVVSSIKYTFLALAVLFLFTVTMLLTATPPFSWIDTLLRDHVPLFGQVFRFPFTKFSLLAGTLYAIFFAMGTAVLDDRWSSIENSILKIGNRRLIYPLSSIIHHLPSFTMILLLFIFMFPLFQGKLFYNQEQLKIPKSYMQMLSFFQQQDPNTRIADLPQPNFWAWEYYSWGYRGSGIIWYGIPQAILHRSFDVWSNYNENYYFELAQAIGSRNPQLFQNVLGKYQVSWLIVDQNLINPTSPKALSLPEIHAMIQKLPMIKRVKTFGDIEIYHVALKNPPTTFVFAQKNLPTVNPYAWSNHDIAYEALGNYIVRPTTNSEPSTLNYIFPFHSLFSLKTDKEKDFAQKETTDTLIFSQKFDTGQNSHLTIPALGNWLATRLISTNTGKITKISLVLTSPTITRDHQIVWSLSQQEDLFTIPKSTQSASLNINGVSTYTIPSESKTIGTTLLSTNQDNILTLTEKNGTKQTAVIPAAYIQKLPLMQKATLVLPKGSHQITVQIPKVTDPSLSFSAEAASYANKIGQCDSFREGTRETTIVTIDGEKGLDMNSRNDTICFSISKDTLSHRLGYAVFADTIHKDGRSLHFWIDNVDQHSVPLDTYFSENLHMITNAYVLAPQDAFGTSYALHFENISIGKEPTQNELFSLSMYPIPYDFLTHLVISQQSNDRTVEQANNDTVRNVSHPNPSLYIITSPSLPGRGLGGTKTLVLSQAYNPGWHLYRIKNHESRIMNVLGQTFPFILGQEVGTHVLINNWENGWNVTSDQTLIHNSRFIILFLPQYLQYGGFVLLLCTLTYASWHYFLSRKKHLDKDL